MGFGTIQGADGEPGDNLVIRAPSIHFADGVTLRAGDGGDGGLAIAVGKPDAIARGGNGAAPGQVILIGEVVGTPQILPARAGTGGDAIAIGASCQADVPQDASARTENATIGDADVAEASADNGRCATIDRIDGGDGGNATAIGGDGGHGDSLGAGGAGGDAFAVGGRGADGWNACFTSEEEASAYPHERAGDGGAGGRTKAVAGDGGAGYVGGRGGDAYAYSQAGRGGDGTASTTIQSFGRTTQTGVVYASPGTGGTAVGGMVMAGGGGFGYTVGGNGGAANSVVEGGNGGDSCVVGKTADQLAPTPIALAPLLLAALYRRFHPTTPK